MAQGQWLRGTVKAVSSGDCLTIVGSVKSGPPPEKTITLSSLMSPRLARRDTKDEPWAWQSREYLRKKVIGKAVVFKVDYAVPSINREFGSVFMDDTNLALDVVANGWARVKTQVNAQSEQSPYLADLVKAEEQAQSQGLGMWNKTPGAAEASVRDLPPSGVGEGSTFDALGLLDECKGKAIPALVEMVRDGSTIRVWLLPSYQFVQVYTTGIQCPSMGRRPPPVEAVPETAKAETNGGSGAASEPLTSAQRLAAANAPVEVAPDPFAREAKHFTETRVLHRDVRIVLDGVDKYNNLFGSIFYSENDVAQDLALQLVSQGLARVVEWSAAMLEPLAKEKLKATERQAKLDKLRLWVNFVPAPSNSVAVRDDNFTGVVIEVVSGDCVVVADDAAPEGSPLAERRVNLSSIRAPKVGNPRRDEKPAPHAREAKEFLRSRLIGQKVAVQMEYTRKVAPTDGPVPAPGGERNMEFGSLFLLDKSKDAEGATVAPTANGEAPAPGINVAEMVVGRGFATVVRHRDFEERSTYYENLVAAEARATKKKAGMHSAKEPPVAHLNDISDRTAAAKAKQFLPFLQRSGRQPAVVDYVLSGHRFKLIIPKESVAVAFSLAGVRCPGRGEPFADEALAFMRRRISQRSVEIEVETVDKTGTFLGSLFENKVNVAVALLENGLAKLHPNFDPSRTASAVDLQRAEEKARTHKVKVWENYDPAAEAAAEAASTSDTKGEVLNVRVTEVVDGSRFYAQVESDSRLSSIEAQLEGLKLKEKVLPAGAFAPKRGELVLGQFTLDDSFARALIVEAPKQATGTGGDKYEVFYVDYGNKETLPVSRLRPMEPGLAAVPQQSHLCSLAHVKVPGLDEEFGVDAAQLLQETVADKKLVARVEERDNSAGRTKGQGVGPRMIVTLVDPESSATIQSVLLEAGLARLEKAGRGASRQKREALEALQEHQELAKKERLNIWQYGDVGSDDEEEPRAWGRR